MYKLICSSLIAFVLLTGCASKKYKDVSFIENGQKNPKLNVFVPRKKSSEQMPVLLFIHGGNWNSGNKNIYGFLGRNFAKKGIITIIPDYTLGPDANYDVMAMQTADVIRWAKANIANYNGNPNQIFITGHSAGGHLAALSVLNPKYGITPNTISGIILNDAAGLDMKHYLEQNPPSPGSDYEAVWTMEPKNWEDASPIYFVSKDMPRFLIYVGDRTYNSIKVTNERFLQKLRPLQPDVLTIGLDKKHIPMILQYFWPWNDRYDEMVHFIRN